MLRKGINILVVDDDPSLRDMLGIVLRKEGYGIEEAESGIVALKKLRKGEYDLVISDIKMPDIGGIELLKRIKSSRAELPVIMITAYSSTSDAVEAMKLGAEDYIIKPFQLEELKILIGKSLRHHDLEKENVDLRALLDDKENFENIVGRNPRMQKVFELIDTIAQTDSTVLISGESGTGKELIARAIHSKSRRREEKFVSINCGALPETLLESELFGHKKGAFTDAYQNKAGLFEVANQGTLFLDEIGETSLNMQVKLLRALQERVIRPVGGNEEIKFDVRIITATNKNLQDSIRLGNFRSDLYYRLNVIAIEMPPLRDRKEDIPLLSNFFLNKFNAKMQKEIKGFQRDVLEVFGNYHWPGNVRELENIVERAVAIEKSDFVSASSLPLELVYNIPEKGTLVQDWNYQLQNNDLNFNEYIDSLSKQIIIRALEMNSGNIKNTAQALKMNYRSLRYLIDKHKIRCKS